MCGLVSFARVPNSFSRTSAFGVSPPAQRAIWLSKILWELLGEIPGSLLHDPCERELGSTSARYS
ncbi:hypothetical protein M404DRAFT_1007404 [Pisolithus tinctorius Marx 270]|uniref:Uncharacterized protein n=1 Tax=Pisolithus tinctorius Marx 270 TaxID=870435 RepID=A0A0C3NIM0_PISTI|nr:hypothetical protein M404DRAFT_1007404 [Pisolithus tinctorius Marx 270]